MSEYTVGDHLRVIQHEMANYNAMKPRMERELADKLQHGRDAYEVEIFQAYEYGAKIPELVKVTGLNRATIVGILKNYGSGV